jgi:HK97 family phage portal protein
MNFIDRFFYNRLKGLNPQQNYNTVIPVNQGLILQGFDEQKYISAYSNNADVYAIVSFLARKASSIPWAVYKIKEGTKAKQALTRYKSLTRGAMTSGAFERAVIARKMAMDDSEPIEGTPLANLIARPNPNQGQDQFFENLFGYRFLTGEGIAWGNDGDSDNPKSEIIEMFCMPSQFMSIVPDRNDLFGVTGYILRSGSGNIPLSKEDVMFWKSWNPAFDASTRDHLRGVSPIRAAWNIYLMGLEAQKAAADQMANGGAKGALVPKAVGNVLPMVTELQATQMQRAVSDRINNNDKKGTVAMLQTPWEYLNFGLSAGDMQLIEGMKFSLEQWCRVFGLPVVLFSADSMADNNYQNALRDLVTNTIVPMCSQLRDELNRWLGPRMGQGQYIDFDIMALPELQKDIDKLVSGLAQASWLTMDEKRMAMNYDALGGAFEKAYVNSGIVPLDQAGMDLGTDTEGTDNLKDYDY